VYVDDADSEEDREVVDVGVGRHRVLADLAEASGLEVPPELNKR